MHKKLNALEVQNNDYQEVIPRLEEHLQVMDVALDALQKD
jgi:hypothetical protein